MTRASTRYWLEVADLEYSSLEALPSCPVRRAVAVLTAAGWWPVELLDLDSAADLCLLAEVVNWGAKTVEPALYGCKAGVVAAARRAGAAGGWGCDEHGSPVYYLHTAETGETSYHDPYGEIAALLGQDVDWPHGWCGVQRQHLALELLLSWAQDGVLLAEVASTTSPLESIPLEVAA